MVHLKQLEVWFATGTQDLYGPDTLKKVAANAREVADALDAAPGIPVSVVFKPVWRLRAPIKGYEQLAEQPASANVS